MRILEMQYDERKKVIKGDLLQPLAADPYDRISSDSRPAPAAAGASATPFPTFS